jgi:hypothetical protein
MGSHGYSQVLVSLVGCLVSRGIIAPFLLFVVVLVVSPVRFILSTMHYAGCRFVEGDSLMVMSAPALILVFTFICSPLVLLWDTALSFSVPQTRRRLLIHNVINRNN